MMYRQANTKLVASSTTPNAVQSIPPHSYHQGGLPSPLSQAQQPSTRASARQAAGKPCKQVCSMTASLSNGFVKQCVHKGADTGHLRGLTFAVKDMYEVYGHTNACGNPTWKATYPTAAASNAPCVQALLDAGATLLGIAHMDELAYSLNGQNFHYGTPVNKAAPSSVPGGSSSGSASVVAWQEVDFAVGSDTAGSVRIPASYQGIFGFRPTHGRVSMAQSVALAPSFDTCGWFARDATTLRKVGQVLLQAGPAPPQAGALAAEEQQQAEGTHSPQWLVAKDAFATCEATSKALYDSLSKDFPAVMALLGEPQEIDITDGQWTLQQWLAVFRTIQSSEVWRTHGAWIEANSPSFGPGIRERFQAASTVTADAVQEARAEQERVVRHVNSVLREGCFMTIPTAPGPAPALDCTGEALEDFRARALALTSIAGLCGLPQATLPLAAMVDGPVGLGIVGPRGSDEQLLALTERLAATLSIP